jgi:large subunit ribosomal protein L15
MELNNLKPASGSTKVKKRLGRGEGSKTGGTAGRGHKGAQSRSGYKAKKGFEGGSNAFAKTSTKSRFQKLQPC